MASTASAIRKAAILVSTLDTQSADRLLDQMGEQLAAQVRSAVVSLGDVPPEIQQAVVEEFLRAQGRGNSETKETAAPSPAVELVLSTRDTYSMSEPRPQPKPAAAKEEPAPRRPAFEFLANTSVETLAAYLQREHIQTIAVVLDQLTPERAAAVLTRFSAGLQSQVVRRLASLDETDPDTLHAIASALESSIGPITATHHRKGSRVQSVRAVVERLDDSQRARLLDRMVENDYDLACSLGARPSETNHSETIRASAPRGEIFAALMESLPAAEEQPDPDPPEAALPGNRRVKRVADLGEVSDAVLATVLREAPAHWVLLALAGAEPKLLARLQKMTPAKQWQGLQQRLRSLGPYRLSDIAAANQALAEIAGRLAVPADAKPIRAVKIAA